MSIHTWLREYKYFPLLSWSFIIPGLLWNFEHYMKLLILQFFLPLCPKTILAFGNFHKLSCPFIGPVLKWKYDPNQTWLNLFLILKFHPILRKNVFWLKKDTKSFVRLCFWNPVIFTRHAHETCYSINNFLKLIKASSLWSLMVRVP